MEQNYFFSLNYSTILYKDNDFQLSITLKFYIEHFTRIRFKKIFHSNIKKFRALRNFFL